MLAHCMIRREPHYRQDAFIEGLKKAGHEVTMKRPGKANKDTLFVTWNRYGDNHSIACDVESAGGRVLVAENGYMGKGGTSPKFDVFPKGGEAGHYYTLMEGWHNGGYGWKLLPNKKERWDALGVEIKPWRMAYQGKYILICPNRSFGVPDRSMPIDWAQKMAARMTKECVLPVKIRQHPGNNSPKKDLQEDLVDAAMVVIWSSSVGVHSLAAGIPTVCEAPFWICKMAAPKWDTVLRELPSVLDREGALMDMACAQWTIEEIASGAPFRHVLS